MRLALLAILLVIALAAGALAYALSPAELDPVEPPRTGDFDAETVARGEQLALIGNCNECHTREAGAAFAGGHPIVTPLGTIYGTNITPDPDTGIGAWSREAFRRAMREGLDREGRHLYPAFPYEHFALMTDADLDDLYAFLMTREPVRYDAPENRLDFPLGWRPLLAGWKLLFHDTEGPEAESSPAAEDRGSYLVRGIGHCGACHTPRNFLQAERDDAFLQGGESEDWYAPALVGEVPAAVRWTEDGMTAYLRAGWAQDHGVAAGPMRPVVRNLARVPEEDVRAMSSYIVSLGNEPDATATGGPSERGTEPPEEGIAMPAVTPAAGDAPADSGEAIYLGACAHCHREGPARYARGLDLRLSTAVRAPDARNLIHIVRAGIEPMEGEAGYFMPGFATLSEAQMTALARYLREDLAGLPSWEGLADTVAALSRTEASGGDDGGSGAGPTEQASRSPAED